MQLIEDVCLLGLLELFRTFQRFSVWMSQISSNPLKKAFATQQYAFLSTSTMFNDIFDWVSTELETRFQVTYIFRLCFYKLLFAFLFCFSHLFAAAINLLQHHLGNIEMGYFYHDNEISKCSCTKFCFWVFHSNSEHFCAYLRLHWANHSDLGITGKTSSSYRTWI